MAAGCDAPEYLLLGKFAGSIAGVRRLARLPGCCLLLARAPPASRTHPARLPHATRARHTAPDCRTCTCTNSPPTPLSFTPPLFLLTFSPICAQDPGLLDKRWLFLSEMKADDNLEVAAIKASIDDYDSNALAARNLELDVSA